MLGISQNVNHPAIDRYNESCSVCDKKSDKNSKKKNSHKSCPKAKDFISGDEEST